MELELYLRPSEPNKSNNVHYPRDQDEVTVCVLPMYHIFAMNVTMSGMLYQGGTTVTVPMFEPAM